MTLKEQLEAFLIAQLDSMDKARRPEAHRAIFNQAFGAVMFAGLNLATNSKKMREIQELWDNDWRKEFEKILYETP